MATIDLRIGHPGTLPCASLAEACRDAAAQMGERFLQYGSGPGNARFLEALAAFLQRRYGAPVLREGLMTTNGASHALELAAATLARRGEGSLYT